MNLLPVDLPKYGVHVHVIVKYFDSWKIKEADMYAVNEDDCNWRFSDCNSELSNSWDVIYWEYKTDT